METATNAMIETRPKMNAAQLQSWTIELSLPAIECEPLPPTRREPHAEPGFMSELVSAQTISAAACWFTERDEAPTRIDGKVRVFGQPVKLTKRGQKRSSLPVPSPRHPDGPGPSIDSVVSNYLGN